MILTYFVSSYASLCLLIFSLRLFCLFHFAKLFSASTKFLAPNLVLLNARDRWVKREKWPGWRPPCPVGQRPHITSSFHAWLVSAAFDGAAFASLKIPRLK